MAGPYGVTPEGFRIKPVTQIVADVSARQLASPAIGPNEDVSTASYLGQLNQSLGTEIGTVWEALQGVDAGKDPEGASGVPLVQVLSLAGSEKRDPKASRLIACALTLDPGTTVPAGAIIAVTDRPDLTFTLDADVENSTLSAGDFPGNFTCTQTGPIAVNAGTAEEIVTTISGWTAVTNPEDAVLGRNVDNDIQFRQRWSNQRAAQGSTTVDAIRATLLDSDTTPEFADIEACIVLQNKDDVADVNGLPAHSVEAIIDDGDTPSVDDDLIAQVLWDRGGAGGITMHGNQSGTAIDSEGNSQVVKFSRVTRKNVYIKITITSGRGFPVDGDTKVAEALVTEGDKYNVDDDVIAEFIKSQAFQVFGVTDITAFAIGFAALPVADDNLPVGYRERAVFDTARVEVSHT